MEQSQITKEYIQAVKAIKQAILESRYRAARLVNKEVLALYYAIGGPDIAFHCYYRRLIEMRGTGIPRMLADCKSNGFAIPSFTISNQVVKLTFPQLQLQNYSSNKNDFEAMLDEVSESMNVKVKQKMVAILSAIDKSPGLRSTAISTFTGIPAKTIERYLSELKQFGLVVYKGSSNSGGYYIVNQNGV